MNQKEQVAKKFVAVRVTQAEKDHIEEMACSKGLTVSDLLRKALNILERGL